MNAEVRNAVRKIVRESDESTMTLRGVRTQLEDELGVEVDKKELKAYVAELMSGGSGSGGGGGAAAGRGAADDGEDAKDPRLASLFALGRVVKFGPSLYKGLKDLADDDARVAEMKARFDAKGVHFHGEAPTAKELKVWRAKKERQEDLEGIDQSLIITGKRSRAAAAPPPSPTTTTTRPSSSDDRPATAAGDVAARPKPCVVLCAPSLQAVDVTAR